MRKEHAPGRNARGGNDMNQEPTLTEVLSSLGYTHHPRRREAWGGREVHDADGNVVFEGTAQACWDWLKENKKAS